MGLPASDTYMFQTMDGQVLRSGDLRLDEVILRNREPIYVMPINHPEMEPQLLLATDPPGSALFGEDIQKATAGKELVEPKAPPVDPATTASGWSKFWNSVGKALGLDLLRPASFVQYDKYRRDMAAPEASAEELQRLYEARMADYQAAQASRERREQVIDHVDQYLTPEKLQQAKREMYEKALNTTPEKQAEMLAEKQREEAAADARRAEADRIAAEKRAFTNELADMKKTFQKETVPSLPLSDSEKNNLNSANVLLRNGQRDLQPDDLATALALQMMDSRIIRSVKEGKMDPNLAKMDDEDGVEKNYNKLVKQLKSDPAVEKVKAGMSPEELKKACNPRRPMETVRLLGKLAGQVAAASATKTKGGDLQAAKMLENHKVLEGQKAPTIGGLQ